MLQSLASTGVDVKSLALVGENQGPSFHRKASFLFKSWRLFLRSKDTPTIVLVGHPSLGLAALSAMRLARIRPCASFYFFYGTDSWSLGLVERRLLNRSALQPVTISAFSAGSLTGRKNALVLHPGLEPDWYDTLVQSHRPTVEPTGPDFNVATVFRLEAAEGKGALALIEAIAQLRERGLPVTLSIAGSGTVQRRLEQCVAGQPWVSIQTNPTDTELASIYAGADLFVLATRTRLSGEVFGEGFGIVLVEAQLSGTPVVAPAFGGSSAAYIEGVTGLRPADESVDALVATMSVLLEDRNRLHQMGINARLWARHYFQPQSRAHEVGQLLLGGGVGDAVTPLRLNVVDRPSHP